MTLTLNSPKMPCMQRTKTELRRAAVLAYDKRIRKRRRDASLRLANCNAEEGT